MPTSDIHALDRFSASSFRVQLRVLYALMIREAMTRYGHKDLGFFWLMADQLILTCGVIAMWTITGMGHSGQAGVVPMAVTGYAFVQLWRHVISHATRAIAHNSHLLYHQNVKVLDLLLANTLLETIGIVSAFLIAYVPLALFGILEPMHDPLLVFGGFALTAWFTFSLGLFITAITELNDAAARVVAPILYITLPFTGLFYMVAWLPDQYQSVMLWSPLVNCIEMIRGGVFPAYMKAYYHPLYVVLWCIALTAIGIPFVHYAQKHSQH